MRRKHVIEYLKIAGYHDDRARLTTLYVENRIGLSVALEAFNQGAQMKKNGVPCSCSECKTAGEKKVIQ